MVGHGMVGPGQARQGFCNINPPVERGEAVRGVARFGLVRSGRARKKQRGYIWSKQHHEESLLSH